MRNLQWLAILFFATGVGYAQPRIWYVDPNVQSGSGTDWQHPTSLDYALTQAVQYDTIWCKKGEYNICASVPNGVSIYGGFSGQEVAQFTLLEVGCI